jgi:DNA polymerase III subunit gamma/tau
MADSHAAPADGAPRFLATARKYRPQTFGDLVGQEHVAGTLRNALSLDRLAHAYLFSGPRGVGKTTAARLLAKAINCEAPLAERPDAEPCRACDHCRSFEQGRDLAVIELDAASHNGVDDIRALRENVLIPPQGARRKVYIVDEVHMLSNSAFNAFLKTLEEPPAHALFIFATTEPHKVLPTILSRCQRFDFRRIATEAAVERLREICGIEGITADDASLHLIARKGDGALRDALSLFDQAVALCGTDLRYDDLASALGVVDQDLFFAVAEQARAGDSAALLRLVDDVVSRGYDLAEFLGGLTEHLRNLFVALSTGDPSLIEADGATRARYLAAIDGLAEADLLRAMMVVDEAERSLRASPQPRLAVEIALLKLAHLHPVADLHALLAHLDSLGADSPAMAVREAPASGAALKPAASGAALKPAASGEAPKPAASGDAPKPATVSPREEPPASRATAEPDAGYRPPPPPDDEPPPPEPPPPAPPPAPAAPSQTRPHPAGAGGLFGPPAIQRRRQPGAEGGDGGPRNAVAVPAGDDPFAAPLGRVQDEWQRLVKIVAERKPPLASVLAEARPDGVQGRAVTIAVPSAFAEQMLRNHHGVFAEALREVLGTEPPPLAFVVRDDGAETARDADPFETIKRLRHEHPTLRMLFDRFGAEIVWT